MEIGDWRFAIRHSASRHSPFATRHSPLVIRHPPFAIRHLATRHPPSRHPPSRHPPPAISPPAIRHSPSATRHPLPMPPATSKPLGPLIATYRDRPLRWRDLLTTFLPASLAVLAPLAYGLWRTYYAQTYYGPAAAKAWGQPWYALAAVALIPLLWLALRRVQRAHRVVQVHKDGIHIRGTRGRQHTLRWEEIGGIASATLQDRFLGFPLRSRQRATLHPLIGKPIQLDSHLPNLDELTARIKARLYPRLLPELRTALRAGKHLYFGPVTLHTRAVQLRGREIAWEQVSLINVRAGYLVFILSNVEVVELHQHRAKKIPVGQIPNVELLIQLIQEGVDV